MTDRHVAAHAVRWLVLLVCAALALALGMFIATMADELPAEDAAPASAFDAARVPPRTVRRAARDPDAPQRLEGEPLNDAELAHATVEDLQQRTATLLADMAVPDAYIAVHSQQPVMAQMLSDILTHAPEVEDELAEEVDRVLCDSQATLADVLLLAKVGLALPQAYSARGVDCVISRSRRNGPLREDAALWAVLELWQASGRPASPAILELSRLARDERTLERLRRDERGVGMAAGAWAAAASDSRRPSQ